MQLPVKTKIIYTRKMAAFLYKSGCILIDTVADEKNPKHHNWIFEDNELLQRKMSEFTLRR